MVSSKALPVLALAAAALAAPSPHRGHGNKHVVWHTVVETAYVTVAPGFQRPEKTSSSPSPVAPAPTTSKVVEYSQYTPEPEPTPEPQPEPESSTVVVETQAPAPTSSAVEEEAPASSAYVAPSSAEAAPPAASSASSGGNGGGYMGVVNEWRAKLGLSELKQDDTLASNAKRTATEGNGQMVHHLYPGSYGQVLAPGQQDEFTHCFVGGWLCEKPNMAGMDGICSTASDGWYYTSTGHVDILTSDNYSKIGCGWGGGIWCCDLA